MAEYLVTAIDIAVHAHDKQKDKAGNPYILHVLRVMMSVETPAEMIAAVLHDVVEDTAWTLKELELVFKFPIPILEAVDALTRRYPDRDPEGRSEGYQEYILRCATNPIALRVKLADLDDHMNYHPEVVSDEAKIRYCKAYRTLQTFIKR